MYLYAFALPGGAITSVRDVVPASGRGGRNREDSLPRLSRVVGGTHAKMVALGENAAGRRPEKNAIGVDCVPLVAPSDGMWGKVDVGGTLGDVLVARDDHTASTGKVDGTALDVGPLVGEEGEELDTDLHGEFCTVYPNPSLMHVLIVHCGGTFGMDVHNEYERATQSANGALRPAAWLADIVEKVPELSALANLDVHVAMNLDSAQVGPREWAALARLLHSGRDVYDAFVLIHGTDTMAYTGTALSFMLPGFAKPVVLTGSQLPLSRSRSDARQNLIDAVTCATQGVLQEVAICFGGVLLRANRAQKTASADYRAFSSPTHPPLAQLGVEVQWNRHALWRNVGSYAPRFTLQTNVVRVSVVPGVDPAIAYGDLYARGVRGALLESFGLGNIPDQSTLGWLPWLNDQCQKGLKVYLGSQCLTGPLNPNAYSSGVAALSFGVTSSKRMTAEAAVVKLMLCLAHSDLSLHKPLAGEL